MPLYKDFPKPSGRMGLLWALAPIKDAAILEFGSMGHMLYAEKWMSQTGLLQYGKLFSTHLDEKDIALGITKRLEFAIDEILKQEKSKALFLLPSSVPEMIGTDLEAIADQVQEKYPDIPILTFKAGNFKASKSQGIEEAFFRLAKHISKDNINRISHSEPSASKLRFTVIGAVCDWARFQSDAREVIRIMEAAFDMEVIMTLGLSSSIQQVEQMGESNINLVLRKEGIKAAVELERRFATPYLYGTPYGLEGTLAWIKQLENIVGRKADRDFLLKEIEEVNYSLKPCKMWCKLRKDRAKLWVEGSEEITKGIEGFACNEAGFQLEQGGILMSDASKLKQEKECFGIEIMRTTASCDYNPYELPYMGFRGAMNLSSLWLSYIAP